MEFRNTEMCNGVSPDICSKNSLCFTYPRHVVLPPRRSSDILGCAQFSGMNEARDGIMIGSEKKIAICIGKVEIKVTRGESQVVPACLDASQRY